MWTELLRTGMNEQGTDKLSEVVTKASAAGGGASFSVLAGPPLAGAEAGGGARSGPAAVSNSVEISVEGVSKSFGSQVVLANLSVSIERGSVVAIVGGSGCGKTVLLKHMIGYLKPDSGRVRIANHEVAGSPLVDVAGMSDIDMDELRRHWAVVFQRNALLSGTVYYNLALWPMEIKGMTEAQIMPLARKALEMVGLDADEILQKRRDELSGGMAKRLAIARALVMDPVLVFYDEPTAGLDPEMCVTIHELIAATQLVMPGAGIARTSVVVTHDMHLLQRLSPRVVMLKDGGILFDGAFEEFVKQDNPHIQPYVEQMGVLQERRCG